MKAVDELDDVLDLSLQRKLAGKVSTEQTYNRQRISIGMKEDGWWYRWYEANAHAMVTKSGV